MIKKIIEWSERTPKFWQVAIKKLLINDFSDDDIDLLTELCKNEQDSNIVLNDENMNDIVKICQ